MVKKDIYIVSSIKTLEFEKILTLSRDNIKTKVNVPRFSPVMKNDELFMSGVIDKKIWLKNFENKDDEILIFPTFLMKDSLRVGKIKFDIELKEIETEEDYKAYLELERFHYRSSPSLVNQDELIDKNKSGRKSILLAIEKNKSKNNYIGYIELAMPLMMVGPRHKSFKLPFKHDNRDINWAEWNQTALKENLNLIVRIARIVTHPTYRGIGIAKILIKAAELFCQSRWHIKKRKPIFLEISAEMLNYYDFVSSCGFSYCGHSDGNINRIAKDMVAIHRGQKKEGGIMSLQHKYYRFLTEFADLNNITIEDSINRIKEIAEAEHPEEKTDPTSWLLLRRILRFPRPYYIKGLDESTENYLEKVKSEKPKNNINFKNFNETVSLKDLTLWANINLPKSKNIDVIKNSFGLTGDKISQKLIQLESFNVKSGSIILLAGASGTGKTIFLDILGSNKTPLENNLDISYEELIIPQTSKFSSLDNNETIIDYFANNFGIEKSLYALSSVGLSEAVPLVKPYWMLSKGQKYRVKLAKLLCEENPVWLLDEFGADLDPITANIVCVRLNKLIKKTGSIAFLAVANHSHFFSALNLSRVIVFDHGIKPKEMTAREYKNDYL